MLALNGVFFKIRWYAIVFDIDKENLHLSHTTSFVIGNQFGILLLGVESFFAAILVHAFAG